MEKIEISHRTIIFTVFFLVFLWFLYQIKDVIILVYISFLTMTALNPLIDKLEKRKVPRPVAILAIYILIFGSISGLVALIIPIVASQTSLFLLNMPKILERLSILNLKINPSDYSQQLSQLPGNIFKILTVTFSGILRIFSFAVITFYLLLERKKLDYYLHAWFKGSLEKRAKEFVQEMETKIGGWVRGEFLLMLIVGVLSYIGLRLLDLDFALPLAIVAGFLELIPNIGPTISMIPAVIVGLGTSPIMGLTVVALYFLIQQLENHLIVPKVMQKSVGLNPLVSIIMLMIGLKIAGALGMLLAIPVFLTLQIVIKEVYRYKNSSSS